MEPHMFPDSDDSHPENVIVEDGDCGVITSAEDHVDLKRPAKKKPRKWAAWTHQEEKSFFSALRQVGKNFEKITHRVQSKNKDQVRHYYYRLVRRMNKLLDPELCLDAKNSKDTNSAMLRWWSLLEKHSCQASQLHRKPRRFKLFIEALEHILEQDRRKKRKRRSHGGSCTTQPSSVSNQGRESGQDARAKHVHADSQNNQKLGSRKGSSLKRIAKAGIDRKSSKLYSSSVKAAKQRRRPGSASKAEYRRWEKAAIAGVSLVADAAEHLERTAMDNLVELVQDIQGEKGFNHGANGQPIQQNLFAENNLQTSTKLKLQLFPIDEDTRRALEMENHNPHLELTLSTRKKISSVLEHINRKWGNSSAASGELALLPYCVQREAILSCEKWTKTSTLSAADVYSMIGSPPLFRLRYGWFSDSTPGPSSFKVPLASVHCLKENDRNMDTFPIPEHDVDVLGVSLRSVPKQPLIGALSQPEHSVDHSRVAPIPRLNADLQSCFRQPAGCDHDVDVLGVSLRSVPKQPLIGAVSQHEHNVDLARVAPLPRLNADLQSCFRQPAGCDHERSPDRDTHLLVSADNVSGGKASSSKFPDKDMESNYSKAIVESSDRTPTTLSQRSEASNGAFCRQDDGFQKGTALSTVEWADSLMNMCVSDMLYDVSPEAEDNCIVSPLPGSSHSLLHIPFIYDSFDAAVAAHLKKHQSRTDFQPPTTVSSIWEGEETCDAFSFHKNKVLSQGEEITTQSIQQPATPSLLGPCPASELSEVAEPIDDLPSQVDLMDERDPVVSPAKDVSGLTDMFWPESLAPLDLDVPSCRYQSDIILSDSLSGLNRLITNGLDGFQSSSFFPSDKKELASTGETRETPPVFRSAN